MAVNPQCVESRSDSIHFHCRSHCLERGEMQIPPAPNSTHQGPSPWAATAGPHGFRGVLTNLRIRPDDSNMRIVWPSPDPRRHLGKTTLSPDRLVRGSITCGRQPQLGIPQGGRPTDRVHAPAVRELSSGTTRTARIVRRIGMFCRPRDRPFRTVSERVIQVDLSRRACPTCHPWNRLRTQASFGDDSMQFYFSPFLSN